MNPMNMRDTARAIRQADIASLPLPEACRALADMPTCYKLNSARLRRAILGALPRHEAARLLACADAYAGLNLSELASVAETDPVARAIVAAVIWLLDEDRT